MRAAIRHFVVILSLAGFVACAASDPAGDQQGDGLTGSGTMRTETPRSVDVPNFTILGPGVAGGGQPELTAFAEFSEKGYSTIVNLRTQDEDVPVGEKVAARVYGLTYFELPVTRETLSLADAKSLDTYLDSAPAGSVFIHCASGNRVGALWGLYQGWKNGLSGEEAVAAGQAAGMRSENLAEVIVTELIEAEQQS